MFELEFENYGRARNAFADLTTLHGSVAAVLSGAADGRVLVDDRNNPRSAVLYGPEGVYLGGSPEASPEIADIRAAIDGWAYLYPAPQWLDRLGDVLPHRFMVAHERIRLATEPRPLPARPLPAGFLLEPDDSALGFVVLRDGDVVSRCGPDMVVGSVAEIGVWTRPDHRRQGFAGTVVAACLTALATAGISEVGWHCQATNRGSLALARRMGFAATGRYQAWSASLPAENAGDIDAETCRSLALRLEEGVSEIGWLDFHVAGAWAQAGEVGRALTAIERLVGGAWQGEAQWLEGHWALACLQDEARFTVAVARQRAK